MVGMLALSSVYHGFKPSSGQTKDYEIGFVVSQLSTQYYGERAKTGWL